MGKCGEPNHKQGLKNEKEEMDTRSRQRYFKSKQLPAPEGNISSRKGESEPMKLTPKTINKGILSPRSCPKKAILVMSAGKKVIQFTHVQISVVLRPGVRCPIIRKRR